MLEVLDPGPLDTIQDRGRWAARDQGVPRSGACDLWSLAVVQRLLGAPPDAAVLEMALGGPTLAVRRTCVVAIAGAELGARVPEEERAIQAGTAQLVHAGTRIVFDPARAGRKGIRAYLGLAGGIDVPTVLGSRSTCLAGAFGGLAGRALRGGDLLTPMRPTDLEAAGRRWPSGGPQPLRSHRIGLLPGPPTLAGPVPDALDALVSSEWRVGPAADRTGIRLAGPSIPVDGRLAGRLVSRGVVPGALQVLPDGSPVVLLADGPTVGGYPVPAVVAQADLPWLGQLGPGDRVRFRAISLEAARAAARAQARALDRLTERSAAAVSWDLLPDVAG